MADEQKAAPEESACVRGSAEVLCAAELPDFSSRVATWLADGVIGT